MNYLFNSERLHSGWSQKADRKSFTWKTYVCFSVCLWPARSLIYKLIRSKQHAEMYFASMVQWTPLNLYAQVP